jgi:hypothetical protein
MSYAYWAKRISVERTDRLRHRKDEWRAYVTWVVDWHRRGIDLAEKREKSDAAAVNKQR